MYNTYDDRENEQKIGNDRYEVAVQKQMNIVFPEASELTT
jgi:hypothetical protein